MMAFIMRFSMNLNAHRCSRMLRIGWMRIFRKRIEAVGAISHLLGRLSTALQIKLWYLIASVEPLINILDLVDQADIAARFLDADNFKKQVRVINGG